MIKTLSTTLIALIILFTGAVFENRFIKNEFNEFSDVLISLYDKTLDQTANREDVYAVQKNWLEKKRKLHAVIPHTEIKEMDLWLSECVMLVHDKEWTDAISKIEVLIELSEQIPKSFTLSFQNIF